MDELAAVDRVAHGFTTRRGGVSEGAFAELNLALRPGEVEVRLRENWSRVCGELGFAADRVAVLDQVHGSEVVVADEPRGPLRPIASADGMVTSRAGVVLAVRVADCVPVLLAAPGAVGAAHAGWRGVAGGVVPATVRALCAEARCDSSDVVAAIGPHIGVEAFEVGEEVVDGVCGTGVPEDVAVRRSGGGRPHVDLGAAVAWQLASAGVRRVGSVGRCTATDPDLYSHRRDGPVTGRLAGVIARMA